MSRPRDFHHPQGPSVPSVPRPTSVNQRTFAGGYEPRIMVNRNLLQIGCFADRERSAYIRPSMGNPSNRKLSWALAAVLVLAHVSPAAAGLLVCIGDGTSPDCCEEVPASEPRTDGAVSFLGDSGCFCCVTIDVVSNKADGPSKKLSIEDSSESGVFRSAVSPGAVRCARQGGDDRGDSTLWSLRTVVLLI